MIFLTIHPTDDIKYHMNFPNLFYLSRGGGGKAKNVFCQDFVAVRLSGVLAHEER